MMTNLLFFPLVCTVLMLSALIESPLVVLCRSLLSDIHVLGTGIRQIREKKNTFRKVCSQSQTLGLGSITC